GQPGNIVSEMKKTRSNSTPGIIRTPISEHIQSDKSNRTPGGCMIFTAMCGSGVEIGMMSVIMSIVPRSIRRGQLPGKPACCAADRGMTMATVAGPLTATVADLTVAVLL